MENIYEEHGFANRNEYLESLAEVFDVDIHTVISLAHMLEEDEDFDGLISALEDIEGGF